MGRGAGQNVQDKGNSLLNTETGLLGQNNTNAQTAQNFLMPAYKDLAASPGYTPQQKSAITQGTEGGIGAAFGAADQGATNLAARTNNTAGVGAAEDSLARERMRTSAGAAAGNETNFANAARQDRNTALGGMQQLYGTATGATGQTLGAANSTLGTLNNNANQPGFWNNFMRTLGAGAGGAVFGSVGA